MRSPATQEAKREKDNFTTILDNVLRSYHKIKTKKKNPVSTAWWCDITETLDRTTESLVYLPTLSWRWEEEEEAVNIGDH